MLTFLSAFLGLVLGVQPVELTVSGDEIASIELRLDGRTVGRLQGEPWRLACDFGAELAPHELTAIGFDSEGREVARTTRWLNLPQPRSRAEIILLDEAADGSRRARLVAHSADRVRPDAWQVRFDGEPLSVDDPELFELPPFDDEEMHFLQAELTFGRSTAHTERIVGGRAGGEVDTELTAYVVALDRGKAPSTEEMQGWFLKGGEPLEVVSVERGGSDIVLVQEATPRLWGRLNRLRRDSLILRNRSFATNRLMSGLRDDDRLRVILPVGELAEGAALEQFHISMDFAAVEQGPTSMGAAQRSIAMPSVQGVLAALPYPPEGALREDAPRRVSDAVAVAAQAASAARRARVVVLIRDSETEDRSMHSPEVVRRYLNRLHVPLVVWSPQSRRRHDQDWGEVQDIATIHKFRRAVVHLRRVLDRQVVIWVRGRHLPQEIELSELAAQRFSPIDSGTVPIPEPEEEPARDPETVATNPLETSPVPTLAPDPVAPDPVEETKIIAAEVPATVKDAVKDVPVDAVEVRLVELHVVVTDKKNQQIRGLGPEDFMVYADGKPVEIQHFTAPPDPDSAVLDPAMLDPTLDPAATDPQPMESVPHLVVFFDALRLDSRGRRELAGSLRNVLGRTGNLRTMIVTYDRSLKIPLPMTSDREQPAELLARIEKGEQLRPIGPGERDDIAREMPEIEEALRNALEPSERRMAESRRDALLTRLRVTAETLSNENYATLGALRDLTSGLGGIEGRKVLLYAGAGLEMSPIADLYDEAAETLDLNPREIAALRAESESFRVHGGFESLLQDAHAADVTFYALTPRHRTEADVVRRARASSSRPGAQLRLQSARNEQIREAVCLLSGESGGLCQVGGSRPGKFLERLAEDLSSHYTLAFTPSHPADGAFHPLVVEVRRPDVTVRHRQGYTDRQSEDRLHDRLAAALFFGVEENALGMTIEVGKTHPAAEEEPVRISLDVRIPVERLGLRPLEQGEEMEAQARLLIATRDASGGVTEVREYPISFRLGADRLRARPPVVYSHEVRLLLAPGEHAVAIGVWDELGELGAFLRRAVSTGGAGT